MSLRTAIVLIPGFFGYGTFGDDPERPLLEYFGGVRRELENAGITEDKGYFIVVHEPPPTGSLDERVASLHDLIGELLAGDPLPHDAKPAGASKPFVADRIHLVGHSTGGVDARLFANKRFIWSGGPRCDGERADRIAKIDQIVTLSAPFYGTPIADHIGGDANLLLQLVQTLTILGVFRSNLADRSGIEVFKSILEGEPLASVETFTGKLWTSLVKSVDPSARATPPPVLAAAPNVTPRVAEQIGWFFNRIDTDRQLLGDLTCDYLGKIAPSLLGGDVRPITSYVTVSPAPPRFDFGDQMIARFVYDVLYRATAHTPLSMPTPQGPTLGDEGVLRKLLADPLACDGVVPARSQTLDGRAAYLVLGDHLDVVGSFQHGPGANVMRSGSDFDQPRFQKLWADISKRLA